ncbi:hypothetical protein KYK30_23630 [Shinella yambaruensis]|uniref:Uncharacterized protein n=1 Tax=Shinella yambaruensis TaxID=415996 RepID=A0ABQ5ZEL2_9HYPH|nr:MULTISPECIES: hypothetical protein [Shinella]MCJ8028572.1 hypothetical protein [Shinella yambaruensis]MCU7982695.1 hypothetical protein [Shinella yambaruensis]MDC7254058.1 hypothetical protein [Shinella sp. YE25]GLR49042.1 hypothetical protein GCM10007923_02470 [Shinella yambaruensis]
MENPPKGIDVNVKVNELSGKLKPAARAFDTRAGTPSKRVVPVPDYPYNLPETIQ